MFKASLCRAARTPASLASSGARKERSAPPNRRSAASASAESGDLSGPWSPSPFRPRSRNLWISCGGNSRRHSKSCPIWPAWKLGKLGKPSGKSPLVALHPFHAFHAFHPFQLIPWWQHLFGRSSDHPSLPNVPKRSVRLRTTESKPPKPQDLPKSRKVFGSPPWLQKGTMFENFAAALAVHRYS